MVLRDDDVVAIECISTKYIVMDSGCLVRLNVIHMEGLMLSAFEKLNDFNGEILVDEEFQFISTGFYGGILRKKS